MAPKSPPAVLVGWLGCPAAVLAAGCWPNNDPVDEAVDWPKTEVVEVVAVDCPNIELDPEAAADGWPKMEPEAREAGGCCPNTEPAVVAEVVCPNRDPELVACVLVLPKTELEVLAVAPKIPPPGLIGELAGAPKMLAEDAGVCPNTLG